MFIKLSVCSNRLFGYINIFGIENNDLDIIGWRRMVGWEK